MTESVEPTQPSASTSGPRRRRAASRPAGAPVKVESTAPVATTTLAAALDPAPEAAEAATPEAPKRPTRRRATRKAAPAAASEAVVVEGGEPAQAPGATDASDAPAEAVAAAKGGEKPARRTRSRRKPVEEAAVPVVDEVAADAAEEAPAEAEPAAADVAAAEAEEAPKPTRRRRAAAAADDEPTKKPTRRRQPKKAEAVEAEGEAAAEQPLDIEAAIAEAERIAQARRAVVANPFMTDADRAAQLAALAGAIAAGDEDFDADDEEPLDEATADDEADEQGDDEADVEADEDTEDAEESEDGEETDEARPSRRRRRRGGRRRRRGGRDAADDEAETEGGDADDAEDVDAGADESDADGDGADDTDGAGTTRRRRRRRRRGASSETDSIDDEVTGIEGSTRMEAKRQRRRESRAAGRRRAPILSEAEFLARRESVDRTMVVRQGEEYTQLAVLEDNVLVEHYVDRPSASSLIGNIYLGKIQNVLPSMEAAFIDIGRGRNAVLYAGEVDWDSFGVTGEDRKVENVLKSGQSIVVQVTKDPVGQKGARLTHHISLPGRYIVYSPGGHLSGISRKLPDKERARLRDILGGLISDDESVIVRTAAEGVGEEELTRDVSRLKAQWEVIEKRAKQGGAPHSLYTEPDLTLRIIRDLFTEDFGRIVVQGDGGQEDAFDVISAYVGHVAPSLLERVERFQPAEDGKDVFAAHRIDEQIAKALDRKVFLPSGGSLVIDRTEAMTVIDVNTGRFTGSGGNLEATVTSNNLEAAEEIVRQLRLRDLGGIIVIDFIDMVLPSNRELLLRRLVECLGRDRTRHQVAEVTSLGLVQLTRKRIGTGLAEAFTEECEHCHGLGYHKFDEPTDTQAPADGGDRPQRRRRKR